MLWENILSTSRLIPSKSVISTVINTGRFKYQLCMFLISSARTASVGMCGSFSAGFCSVDIVTAWTLSHCRPVTDRGKLLSWFSCKCVIPVLVLLINVNTCSLFSCCFPLGQVTFFQSSLWKPFYLVESLGSWVFFFFHWNSKHEWCWSNLIIYGVFFVE